MEHPVDYRTGIEFEMYVTVDFYSLGISLWELLIGRKPYDFDASDIAVSAHISRFSS